MNDQALVEAQGVMHDSGTMVNLDNLDTIDLSILNCSYPFPQVFKLTNYTLVCTETKIYSYSGTSLSLVHAVLEGSTWTIADFYDYIVLSNGKDLVVVDPVSGAWSSYAGCQIPFCLCLCSLNGQLIVGGPEVTISQGFLG
jgi:hypothetical protein